MLIRLSWAGLMLPALSRAACSDLHAVVVTTPAELHNTSDCQPVWLCHSNELKSLLHGTPLCRWAEDDFFAEQRVSGANPLVLTKLDRDDARAEILEDLNLDFSVNSELSKGNIYVCDYTGTDPAYRGPCMVTVRPLAAADLPT